MHSWSFCIVCVNTWTAYFGGDNRQYEYNNDYWGGSSKVENKSLFFIGCGGLFIFEKNVNLDVAYARCIHVWL
jgi:arabinogalactan endo-1,4-beta-galactosidase